MLEDFLYCIDRPVFRKPNDESPHLIGWCLSRYEILALQAKLPTGLASVNYPLIRADVAKAFPLYPHAERSGFLLSLPKEWIRQFPSFHLLMTVRDDQVATKILSAEIQLNQNGIWKAQLLPVTDQAFARPASRQIEHYLKLWLAQKNNLTLRLDIINKCNLRCIMCHFSDETFVKQPLELMTPHEFKHVFTTISPYVQNVMLACAFEPLMSKHFEEILAILSAVTPPLHIGLVSNATLLNATVRRALLEHGATYLILSMDGCTKATLERIRRGAKFEKVVANILAFRDLKRQAGARFPYITMDFVMLNSNLHEAPRFVEMCSRLGVSYIDFRHAVPSAFFNDVQELLGQHPQKYNFYRNLILQASKKYGVTVFLPEPFAVQPASDAIRPPEVSLADFERVKPDVSGSAPVKPKTFPADFPARPDPGLAYHYFPGIACHHPFSEIMISNKVGVRPCVYYQELLGQLDSKHTLHDIFFGKPFQEARMRMFDPEGDPNCRSCPNRSNYFAKAN
jgi:MoaA/NifB/PqqE/SkfB family radical SAM enzyme